MNEKLIENNENVSELKGMEMSEQLDMNQQQIFDDAQRQLNEMQDVIPTESDIADTNSEEKSEETNDKTASLGATDVDRAKKYGKWAIENGFTGWHLQQAKYQYDRAVKKEEEKKNYFK